MTIGKRDLGGLLTEQRNPRSQNLDSLPASEIARLMVSEDQQALQAVAQAGDDIARAMELVSAALARGGRLFYVGAGTSGRLGVLDASECPPTFGVPFGLVNGIIAGGWRALQRSQEGAEDHPEQGAVDLRVHGLQAADFVIGIAASGVTAYVHGALACAREVGAGTGFITCHDRPELDFQPDVLIVLVTGPEVVTGSTRLKAGTATKLTLNMITTGAMVLLGKVHENLMVDLRPWCAKLQDRAERILMELCAMDRTGAASLLAACGDLKTALVCELASVNPDQARQALQDAGGVVRTAVSSCPKTTPDS